MTLRHCLIAALVALAGCTAIQKVADEVSSNLVSNEDPPAEAAPEAAPASVAPASAALVVEAPPAAPAPVAQPMVQMPAMPAMPAMPQMPQRNTSSPRERMKARQAARQAGRRAASNATQTDEPIRCCINGAYYACDSGADAAQCIGQPMDLMQCMQGCGIDSGCERTCLKKHGPDPSACSRNMGRDGDCPKRR